MYRALVVCHMAGAVFAVIGWLTARGAIAPAFQTPTLVVAVVQLAVAWWLLQHPAWLPRLLLGFPRPALVLSVAMTLFYLAPATDPVAPPTTTVAFAWIATAAAVLPPRGWPRVGLAATVGLAAAWAVAGLLDPDVGASAILIGAASLLPGALNGAWMGATGNTVARRVRRWGLMIGSEAGAMDQLTRRAAVVREAADDVLAAVPSGAQSSSEAISATTLQHASIAIDDSAADAPAIVRDGLQALVRGLRLPFTVSVDGAAATIDPAALHVVGEAVLRHLTNVSIHAPGTAHVQITVGDGSGWVTIACEDDGGGAPPDLAGEGEGTGISRTTLASWGGELRYARGASGVRLELRLPSAASHNRTSTVGLVVELRTFIDQALRNNRYASYASPLPFLAFGMHAPPWAIPLLLSGAAAVEWSMRRAGPSLAAGPVRPLLVPASVAVVVTLLFALGLEGDQAFVCSAATAYPIVELAWRGHWRSWALFEVLRGLAVLPWLMKAGVAGIGGAFVLPVALTLIAVGARRLVMRATAVETRIGGVLERRAAALDLASQAALRHDVVDQLRGAHGTPALAAAVARLDHATRRLADVDLPPLRPVDDVLEGVRASLAPAVLVVSTPTHPPLVQTDRLPAPIRVERRLALLELGAVVGDQLALAYPPTWTGRRRLSVVRAEVDLADPQRAVVRLRPPEGHPDRLRVALPDAIGAVTGATVDTRDTSIEIVLTGG